MIPRDFQERLNWMYEHYHLNLTKAAQILKIKNDMQDSIFYENSLFITLYEEPEGSPRPRTRIINRENMKNLREDPLVTIYSLTGASDKKFMKELVSDEDFCYLDHLINTPCNVDYKAYFRTPKAFNSIEVFLSELGLIRPITKPDFDNVEKKYSDMYTGTIWIDDSLVIESSFAKYYSILPRIEITLKYLNMLYNKYQYDSIIKRIEEGSNVKYFKKE